MTSLVNSRVIIHQERFRFVGIVLEEDSTFVTILDQKTNRKTMLNRSSITSLEVLDE